MQTGVRKLLVLRGPAMESEGVVGFLQEHFEVRQVADLDEALDAMREAHFDAVLAETADFLPIERGVAMQQASAVLDTIGDGVCIVGPEGAMVWANRRMREYPASVLDQVRAMCLRAYAEFQAAGDSILSRGRRFSLMPEDGAYYEIICSPVLDRQGHVRQVAAVTVNATARRAQQQKFNAIDRAGRELVSLQREDIARRDASERLQMLEELIVRCSRNVLKYEHFELFLLDEQSNVLTMTMCHGLDRSTNDQQLLASTSDNGICGYVAATARSYVCPEVAQDRRYLPGLAGARSSLTVPLRLHDKVIGVLNVESRVAAAFNEEDRQFAEIFAHYLALALNVLNLLVTERHTAHAQVSGSISAGLAGPVNDIITDLSGLMEDYIGHDDLRRRISAVVDQVARVRQAIQRLPESPATAVLAASGPVAGPDPVLAGRKVLVAEDEPPMRQTIHDVLSACGCEVDTAADGAEAIERIAAEPYDLVISDIKMPKASGYDVFAAVKARRGQTPVILITAFGYDPGHTILRARKEGLSAVLMKPFRAEQLLSECRRALEVTPQ
ncbi:MAG TPA: response regulator [Phycisphaerae bacterium]|nr:response regulator [Phycisphaerae bacterium]